MALEPRLRPLVWASRGRQKHAATMSVLEDRVGDRGKASAGIRLLIGPAKKVRSVDDVLVPVEGGEISVRIYTPEGDSPRALYVFFHGGGWATGTVGERDTRCQNIAVDAGCVVASVGYRLAPDCQYPTAPNDCYAALTWLVEHAGDFGVDSTRVAVGGESSGGNLAAVVCLMARDRRGPRIVLQLLDVPALDLTLEQPSTHRLAKGYVLTRDAMARYVRWYLPDPAMATEPYASPLHAPDLSGLPPAVITTCEYDPLRDEGEAYAKRLEDAGVPTVHRMLEGHVHVSFALSGLLASARAHHEYCVRSLRESFGTL